jgi:hypothetical protein
MADDQEKLRARQAKAYADATNATAAEANYYVRDPKTGLSPAQVEANKAVSEAAASSGRTVTAGATGASATSDRVTLTGADRAAKTKKEREDRFAAELAAREASKPTTDPGPGNIWSYSVAEGRWKKVFTGAGFGSTADAEDDAGDGSGSGSGAGDGTIYTAPDGRIFTDLNAYNTYITKLKADEKLAKGESAFNIFRGFLAQYGLEGLAADVEKYKIDGLSDDELLIRLRTESTAYKNRFKANEARIKSGLRALSEAQYIEIEDQYQDVMRRYGLPESYYTRGEMGRQEGFEKFIAGDVSSVELEDRIQTAQRRVLNADPQIKNALTQFYGSEISNGDILAYVLDPAKAIENIKRKVTAAEIGGGALRAGLGVSRGRAEELGQYGVTKESAQQGFGTIASGLERGRQLSQIYNQPDYTQAVAESEVFSLPDAEKARRQRRKLGQLETTTFSGTSGVTGGALDRERAGQY